MSDNAEEGIARVQATGLKNSATQGEELSKYQKRSIAYLDDRILIYFVALAFLALMLVWATAQSTLSQIGSLMAAIFFTIIWGIARVKRIDRVRQERELISKQWASKK